MHTLHILHAALSFNLMIVEPIFGLQYLDQEDSSRPIYMYINCPGGSVIAGLAIYDVMQLIRCVGPALLALSIPPCRDWFSEWLYTCSVWVCG